MKDKQNLVQISNINKSYGNKKILKDISFSIAEGCICGLLGPSGCGKTTTVKILAGILSQDSGEVIILNQKMPNLDLMAKIGYMAQSSALYESLTAEQNLKFFGALYGLKGAELNRRIEYVMEIVDLKSELKKKVNEYSGGMKQRLSLAVSLLADPKVLILDEPTVGIDPVLRQSIWKELYKLADQGVTILITTHVMDEAEKCHQLAMLRDGQMIAIGTPTEIIKKSGKETIEQAFIYFGTTQNEGDTRYED